MIIMTEYLEEKAQLSEFLINPFMTMWKEINIEVKK